MRKRLKSFFVNRKDAKQIQARENHADNSDWGSVETS